MENDGAATVSGGERVEVVGERDGEAAVVSHGLSSHYPRTRVARALPGYKAASKSQRGVTNT